MLTAIPRSMVREKTIAMRFPLAGALLALVLSGCGGGGGGDNSAPPTTPPGATLDDQVRAMITTKGLTGDPAAGRDLPSIDDPLAKLGKLLFFSKSLGGDMDTACASCHHPALGGGDGIALSVGIGAVDSDVVGPGRQRPDGLPNVGRHSTSVFNVGLYDEFLFWDGRIESIGKEAGQNGSGSGIRTPETAHGAADTRLATGTTLVAAQALFPVTVPEEMRGSLLPGASSEDVWDRLAARLGDYGPGQGELQTNNWLAEFQAAFVSSEPADTLVTFENIALAMGEYQRSMIFTETPWKAYVEGDNSAIGTAAKQGALLFFGDVDDQRLACGACHGGDFFTDERMTVVGFPQTGPGKGDGPDGDADFGREQQTGNSGERFMFRNPTLLNLLATAPYGHTGTFSLDEATLHYFLPDDAFDSALPNGSVCGIEQFASHPDCASLFPNTVANSQAAFDAALQQRQINPDLTFPDLFFSPPTDAPPLAAFMEALTDPCTLDRACLAPWIPDPSEAPDENQLNAVDRFGDPL